MTRNEQAWDRIINRKPQLRAPVATIPFDPARPASMFDQIRRYEDAHDGVRTLERGKLRRPAPRSTSTPISVSGGVNGVLPVRHVVDRTHDVSIRAVLKSVAAGGAQERFAYEVAASIGLDHLLPRIGRRQDGTAAIEFVKGKTFWQHNIKGPQDLEKALRHSWGVQFPDMSKEEIRRRARIDRQLVQLFDFVLANGDRHGQNALYDARSGRLTLIDHGLVNRNDPIRGGIVARVRGDFQGGDGVRQGQRYLTMRVEPEVQALVQSTDRRRIENAFRTMIRDVGSVGRAGSYSRPPTQAFLGQIMTRLDEVARTGLVRVLC